MSIYISSMTLPGARIGDNDPLPRFRRETGFTIFKTKGDCPPDISEHLGAQTRTMPYRLQDRYGSEFEPVTIKTIVLENRYLKATFTPEYGGKLWSLFDKTAGRDLLFANSVLRPRNLGIRTAWTSGGIEWNFGSLGHTVFTSDDLFAAVLKDESGNDFLRMYEFERSKECVWQMDFHLPEDSHLLLSHVRLINPKKEDATTYWWTNIAVPEDGGTRVLSSTQDVIAFGAHQTITFEKLPFLSVMDGDLSYPKNATRSFDYFFNPPKGVKTAWEAGAAFDGYTFFDRSTAPLVYHKMFCWGNHEGGRRWQDYLSVPGKGDYIELQAGIAMSQVHDKPFPAGAVYEWTQCFGGMQLDADKVHKASLEAANAYAEDNIDRAISEEQLFAEDERLKAAANVVPAEKDIVHNASGWGALEQCRRSALGETPLPSTLCFPQSSLGNEQAPWLELLEKGILSERDPDEIPVSWMVSPEWMKLLEESLDRPGGRNWYSLLHYGNMLFEFWNDTVTADEAVNWPESEQKRYEALAEEAWKESDRLRPNVWARRNLARLELARDNYASAEAYYDSVFELPASTIDFAFCAEYMDQLCRRGQYEKAWSIYDSMPDQIRNADRVSIHAAVCAVKTCRLDIAEELIMRDHATIREGENSLTDMWFELCAKKMAAAEGIDPAALDKAELEKLKEKAEEDCPPPRSIDFRMSYDKKNKYRV